MLHVANLVLFVISPVCCDAPFSVTGRTWGGMWLLQGRGATHTAPCPAPTGGGVSGKPTRHHSAPPFHPRSCILSSIFPNLPPVLLPFPPSVSIHQSVVHKPLLASLTIYPSLSPFTPPASAQPVWCEGGQSGLESQISLPLVGNIGREGEGERGSKCRQGMSRTEQRGLGRQAGNGVVAGEGQIRK